MQTITSLRNPTVQAMKALQQKAAREESGLFLCEGEHLVGEAIRFAPDCVRTVLVDEAFTQAYAGLLREARNADVYAVPAHVLAAVSQVKAPQGIAAAVTVPPRVSPEALGDRVVLLENVQDPGNVGTVLRTVDAAGFDGCVLTPGCADPLSPKALRATMGSVFRVPCAVLPSAPEAAAAFAARGYAVLAAVLDGEDFYNRKPLPRKVCLMVGNEGSGITEETRSRATHLYRLPMRGGAESLNAAVAAAVFMYEIVNRG